MFGDNHLLKRFQGLLLDRVIRVVYPPRARRIQITDIGFFSAFRLAQSSHAKVHFEWARDEGAMGEQKDRMKIRKKMLSRFGLVTLVLFFFVGTGGAQAAQKKPVPRKCGGLVVGEWKFDFKVNVELPGSKENAGQNGKINPAAPKPTKSAPPPLALEPINKEDVSPLISHAARSSGELLRAIKGHINPSPEGVSEGSSDSSVLVVPHKQKKLINGHWRWARVPDQFEFIVPLQVHEQGRSWTALYQVVWRAEDGHNLPEGPLWPAKILAEKGSFVGRRDLAGEELSGVPLNPLVFRSPVLNSYISQISLWLERTPGFSTLRRWELNEAAKNSVAGGRYLSLTLWHAIKIWFETGLSIGDFEKIMVPRFRNPATMESTVVAADQPIAGRDGYIHRVIWMSRNGDQALAFYFLRMVVPQATTYQIIGVTPFTLP